MGFNDVICYLMDLSKISLVSPYIYHLQSRVAQKATIPLGTPLLTLLVFEYSGYTFCKIAV